jgi:hypothetical protein
MMMSSCCPLLLRIFAGDQPMNAAKLKAAGMAEFVPHPQVTAPKIQELLHLMLHNQHSSTYQAAARRMKALVSTLAKHNTNAAADMLEFFAEYGWDHLVTASTRMSWLKATNADLYGVTGVAALLALIVGGVVISLTGRVVAACDCTSNKSRAGVKKLMGGFGGFHLTTNEAAVNGAGSCSSQDAVCSGRSVGDGMTSLGSQQGAVSLKAKAA